ncbi:MAG: hypothetical protein WAM11_04705 [Cyanobium sp.]
MGGIGAEVGVIGMGHSDMNHTAIPRNSVQLLDDVKKDSCLLAETFEHMMELNLLGHIVVKWPGKTLKIDDAIRLAARLGVNVDETLQMAAATTEIQSQVPAFD